MYLIEAHYTHIVLGWLLALWLPLVRSKDATTDAARTWRIAAWLLWGAAALLAANAIGHHLFRAARVVTGIQLERTLTMMMVWPAIVALVLDRFLAWRSGRSVDDGTGFATRAAVIATVGLPSLLIGLFAASAVLGSVL